MKHINMNIVYLFYEVFIILEIKVVLISYSSSKAASKAAETNGLIALIKPHYWQYPASPEWGICKQMMASIANSSYRG